MHKPKQKRPRIGPSIATPLNIPTVRPSTVELKRAPLKPERRKKKRRLFTPTKQEKDVLEIQELIPIVLKKLEKEELKHNFCSLIRLIVRTVDYF